MLFIIITIFIAACIETDIYLPAFSQMMDHYSMGPAEIQRILTWNFVGMCIAGPVYGPLSDVKGRRVPLLFALSLFTAGSGLTVFSHSYEGLLLGRVLQGVGSGGCFTLGTAILFDVYSQEHAVIALAKINSLVPFLLASAPLLGGYLTVYWGFRANFTFILMLVLLSWAVCFLFYKESLPANERIPWDVRKLITDLKTIGSNGEFWRLVIVVSVLFGGYMTYLSGSAVVFVEELKVSTHHFPFYQATVLGAWLLASLVYKPALLNFGKACVQRVGIQCVVFGGFALCLVSWCTQTNALLLTLPMVPYTFGVNWVQGLLFPAAMELVPHCKGIAASLLTSLRLLITSWLVEWAAQHYNGTLWPATAVALLATVCTIGLTRRQTEGLGSNLGLRK